MIRAAAKNYNDVVIVASQAQYQPLRDMLMEHGATTSLEERRWFAKEAFAVSSHYDSAIFNYFDIEQVVIRDFLTVYLVEHSIYVTIEITFLMRVLTIPQSLLVVGGLTESRPFFAIEIVEDSRLLLRKLI